MLLKSAGNSKLYIKNYLEELNQSSSCRIDAQNAQKRKSFFFKIL